MQYTHTIVTEPKKINRESEQKSSFTLFIFCVSYPELALQALLFTTYSFFHYVTMTEFCHSTTLYKKQQTKRYTNNKHTAMTNFMQPTAMFIKNIHNV